MAEQQARLETFMELLLPTLASERRGAASHEIKKLEKRIERRLPEPYRYFLSKMGHEVGPMRFNRGTPQADYSLSAVKKVNSTPKVLLAIGISRNPGFQEHTQYRLSGSPNEASKILNLEEAGNIFDDDGNWEMYSSLYEFLAWKAVDSTKLFPARCSGTFRRKHTSAPCFAALLPALELLGFKNASLTGPGRTIFIKKKGVLRTLPPFASTRGTLHSTRVERRISDETTDFELNTVDPAMLEDVLHNVKRISDLDFVIESGPTFDGKSCS